LLVLLVLIAGVVAGAPSLGRWYLRSRLLPRVERILKRSIVVGEISINHKRVRLERLRVTSKDDLDDAPMASIPEIELEYELGALLGGSVVARRVVIRHPRLNLVRHEDGRSNFLDLTRRRKKGKKGGGKGRLKIHLVQLEGGSLTLEDRRERFILKTETLEGKLALGKRSKIGLGSVQISSPRTRSGLSFARVELAIPHLRRGKLKHPPQIRLDGGEFQLLPRLKLSGIHGTIAPDEVTGQIQISLDGSYGGAEAKLWSARGWLTPDRKKGRVKVRAARFSLGRIASILRRTPVILPHHTMIDGQLELTYERPVLGLEGKLEVSRLSLFHPSLARAPVLDLSGRADLAGHLHLAEEELELEHLNLSSGGVEVRLSGKLARLTTEPLIELQLQVPAVACQKVVDAFPPSLVPQLQGFELKGKFSAELHTEIDYRELNKVKLGGKVRIYRCKVVKAPEAVSAERLAAAFEHQVEPIPQQHLVFAIGPDNPNFVPYREISPAVIKAFLTTEDGGFFRHRGYIPSMFEKALSRNLQRGGFRLGASTISMQMVKNVLLSHEKTLSRKLQELFLTWYLEQNLTKERIMEIYLNAIEFGPSIYGIGAAARHYFNKSPSEITPLEAAFFSSILPSPKRRYIQYCNGQLSPRWDKYVRRILRRMASRKHIDEAALTAAADQQVVFDRNLDDLSQKECAEQVKDLVESWRDENRDRLKNAILQAAPHQVDMYIKNK
jgi:hypothetical protein